MQLYFSTLGFRYFEFRFIYERIPNRIRIRIFGIFVLALVEISLISSILPLHRSILLLNDLKVPVITQVFVIFISVAYLTDAPVFQ